MSKVQIRPRFRITVPMASEEILNRLRAYLEKPNSDCSGTILSDFAILRIPEEKQHFWSPRLTVAFEKEADGTLLRGLFGPRPAVWTMFASFYAFTVFAALVGAIYGLSQWQLGMDAWALWIVPTALVLLVIAYAIAYTGQKLGHDEMRMLRKILEDCLEKGSGSVVE